MATGGADVRAAGLLADADGRGTWLLADADGRGTWLLADADGPGTRLLAAVQPLARVATTASTARREIAVM